jgi:Na+-driven multidrug efflux pump
VSEPGQPLSPGARQIAQLALPALGVLAAEPLYLLFDTAIVGRLGAQRLAGLAIGGLILGMVASQLTFLSYGTTARAARYFGADDRAAAVREGVQATWLALGLGAMIAVLVQAAALPLVSVIAGSHDIAPQRCPGCASPSSVRPQFWCRWPAMAGCAACRTPFARCAM